MPLSGRSDFPSVSRLSTPILGGTKFCLQAFTRAGENLFQTGGGYYGRIKKKGKVHKISLEADYAMAKRRLKDIADEVETRACRISRQIIVSFKSHPFTKIFVDIRRSPS
jgi:hypothetical protein